MATTSPVARTGTEQSLNDAIATANQWTEAPTDLDPSDPDTIAHTLQTFTMAHGLPILGSAPASRPVSNAELEAMGTSCEWSPSSWVDNNGSRRARRALRSPIRCPKAVRARRSLLRRQPLLRAQMMVD